MTAAVLSQAAAVLSCAHAQTPGEVNLHRVGRLLDADVRALWIGDSWCRLGRVDRVPFGAIATWPGLHATAVSTGYYGGNGLTQVVNYTSGEGALDSVDGGTGWEVELNGGVQAYFALPISNLTKLVGLAGLNIPDSGAEADLICALRVNNTKWVLTDNGPFTSAEDAVRVRPWYYAPADIHDQVERLRLLDVYGNVLAVVAPAADARRRWHLGEDPSSGAPRDAAASQMNAFADDPALPPTPALGPRIVIAQDPARPIAGSGRYWFFGGATFYKVDDSGARIPGYYHSGLSQDSWSLAGLRDDLASEGGKTFSDAQLLHWLDVTTLDRSQAPVVILHIATEDLTALQLEELTFGIVQRFRSAFARIGTATPAFLLLGSYMHVLPDRSIEQSRAAVERLDAVYAQVAREEPDCAFYSLYQATDGVFLTSDGYGGPGAQQAARDWLDAAGWSTLTFGGVTYHLSTATDGGLDGVLLSDGLHLNSLPAAAFYAKLLGDAIAASACPADFNGDGSVDSRDVLAFLNTWAAGDSSADFNSDGVINTMDVIDFLNAWNEPC